MNNRALIVIISTILWFIAFALQGAGLVANDPHVFVGGIPLPLLYMLIMGVWGVANSLLAYFIWAPGFYERAYKLLEEEQ